MFAPTAGVEFASEIYDSASRLASVTDGNNNSAIYSFLANSPLVSQIAFKQSGSTRMTTTKQYDYLNRLTTISSSPGASGLMPVVFNYNYNPANQRTKNTLADGSYWIYGYDSLGQVTNACKYWADGTHVAGQQFDYAFDTIGNRTQTLSGGDTNGVNLRVANYYANDLNQITQRDVPGTNDVVGATWVTNNVSVNGTPASRKVEYFQGTVGTNNANTALWLTAIVNNGTGSSVTGNVYVPQSPEQFSYDADGNLTSDGRWNYTWDAENRLVMMTVSNNTVGPQYQLTFAYDAQGRRIQKTVATNSGRAYVEQYTDNFLYDGWNLVAEVAPNHAPIRTYMWGSDLSGSMQGAGGVGGLLEVSYYGTGTTTNCFPAYDGNGNVAALINAADGTVVANYDYAAFGEPIRITGSMAKNNPFRFSTKYADDESDLLYYGYRYYKPSTGTWPSRDPIQESGGKNLYAFVANRPIMFTDRCGELTIKSDGQGEIRNCGEHKQRFDYFFDSGHSVSGYLVQKVTVTTDWYFLCCSFVHTHKVDTFYEFGATGPTDPDDKPPISFAHDDDADPSRPFTKGTISASAEARWFPIDVTGTLHGVSNQYNDGPNTFTGTPTWWDQYDKSEAPATRTLTVTWSCCFSASNPTSVTSSPSSN
jgi:RHS repeat-associated protein